jgi:hypothetical protein
MPLAYVMFVQKLRSIQQDMIRTAVTESFDEARR